MSLSISFDGITSKHNEYFSDSFLTEKLNSFQNIINDSANGFFNITDRKDLMTSCQEIFKKFQSKKTFVQVGIGGSSLGPEMLVSALPNNKDRKFIFINNIDPEEISDQLRNLDIEDTLFYFVSKSGGTAEPMSALAIITNILNSKGVVEKDLKNYYVFGTDPKKSALLTLGKELGVSCLEVPSNVGGRFSVLTPVGFLPALFAGINLEKLINGANSIKTQILSEDLESNDLLKMASTLMAHKEDGFNQTVFMPYSSRLRNFSFWFIQLWAESLGKRKNKDGDDVNTGLTPIPGYGATDQHSQVQLFMEGPYDKVHMLVEVEEFSEDYSLENNFNCDALKLLAPFKLSELMKAELEGTKMAFKEANRPFITFKMSKNDEDSLGQLIMFLESLTALMGEYLNIDPFDQPGVEAGKRFAYQWLDKLKG